MLQDLYKDMLSISSLQKAQNSSWFFQTGKEGYAKDDKFIGVTVPEQRKIAKKYEDLTFSDILVLLESDIHEYRLTALIILVSQYQKATRKQDLTKQSQIYNFYLEHRDRVNNWDLVDTSAKLIVGHYLYQQNLDMEVLENLATSKILWDRRIAVIASWYFILQGEYQITLELSKLLIHDREDLIEKAVGWMLREVGKKDVDVLREFLNGFGTQMGRTCLRYAIEKFETEERLYYLKSTKKN